MSGDRDDRLRRYFEEADTWARDREGSLRRSRRIAWIAAAAALALAILEAGALILLLPLKTVVPYTLLVDRQTGFVQALQPLEAQTVSRTAALTQSFLVQYVLAREGFDADTLQSDYRRVALWSDGQARSEYLAGMQVSSADSPLARYPRSTIVEARVKSVTALSPTISMVRFDTRRRDAGGVSQPAASWVAYVRYRYSDAPLSVEDRMVNPLGFQVLRYRRSAEVLEAEPEPASSPRGSAVLPTITTPVPSAPLYQQPSIAPYPAPQVPPASSRQRRSAPAVQL